MRKRLGFKRIIELFGVVLWLVHESIHEFIGRLWKLDLMTVNNLTQPNNSFFFLYTVAYSVLKFPRNKP